MIFQPFDVPYLQEEIGGMYSSITAFQYIFTVLRDHVTDVIRTINSLTQLITTLRWSFAIIVFQQLLTNIGSCDLHFALRFFDRAKAFLIQSLRLHPYHFGIKAAIWSGSKSTQ